MCSYRDPVLRDSFNGFSAGDDDGFRETLIVNCCAESVGFCLDGKSVTEDLRTDLCDISTTGENASDFGDFVRSGDDNWAPC